MIIDRSSLAMSSIMGMWGPLEFLAMGAQAGIAYQKIENGQELTINATSLRRLFLRIKVMQSGLKDTLALQK